MANFMAAFFLATVLFCGLQVGQTQDDAKDRPIASAALPGHLTEEPKPSESKEPPALPAFRDQIEERLSKLFDQPLHYGSFRSSSYRSDFFNRPVKDSYKYVPTTSYAPQVSITEISPVTAGKAQYSEQTTKFDLASLLAQYRPTVGQDYLAANHERGQLTADIPSTTRLSAYPDESVLATTHQIHLQTPEPHVRRGTTQMPTRSTIFYQSETTHLPKHSHPTVKSETTLPATPSTAFVQSETTSSPIYSTLSVEEKTTAFIESETTPSVADTTTVPSNDFTPSFESETTVPLTPTHKEPIKTTSQTRKGKFLPLERTSGKVSKSYLQPTSPSKSYLQPTSPSYTTSVYKVSDFFISNPTPKPVMHALQQQLSTKPRSAEPTTPKTRYFYDWRKYMLPYVPPRRSTPSPRLIRYFSSSRSAGVQNGPTTVSSIFHFSRHEKPTPPGLISRDEQLESTGHSDYPNYRSGDWRENVNKFLNALIKRDRYEQSLLKQ